MNGIDFLSDKKINVLARSYQQINEEKRRNAFNLFTLSTYGNQLENYHSDIIGSLLNPVAGHNEKDKFLFQFINYLATHSNCQIHEGNYKAARVLREIGRIDLWVVDETSKHAIIIENKINDADDMDDQIDRYYEYNINLGYQVDCIVYLTLDGIKKAPPTTNRIENLIFNVGAFENKKNDFVNGWLEPCVQQASTIDNQGFIAQYIKLIKHLSNHAMDNEIMNEFYRIVGDEKGINTLDFIVKMKDRLPVYRADQFAQTLSDIRPFNKCKKYQPNYWIYEGFIAEGQRLKVDVVFKGDGDAQVTFWNTSTQNQKGRDVMTTLLSIDLVSEFDAGYAHGDNGYSKLFQLSAYNSMELLDNAVLDFTNRLFAELREG